MTFKEITQRITLLRAAALGWVQPDFAESLDALEHDAERWLARWAKDAEERYEASNEAAPLEEEEFCDDEDEWDYDDAPLTPYGQSVRYADEVCVSVRRWEG
jgi:hypothetical protein